MATLYFEGDPPTCIITVEKFLEAEIGDPHMHKHLDLGLSRLIRGFGLNWGSPYRLMCEIDVSRGSVNFLMVPV